MNCKGIVGVGVLWILAAIGLLSYTFLRMVQGTHWSLQQRVEEINILNMAQTVGLKEKESGFKLDSGDYLFKSGEIHYERIIQKDPTPLRLTLHGETRRHEKWIQTGWQKMDGGWQMTYWNEQ